jgi:hypothetical protein
MLHAIATLAAHLTLSLVAGGLAGWLTAYRALCRRKFPAQLKPLPPDTRVASYIDQAATNWAQAHGSPEAARLVADKLHLLDHLGRRRGWLR